MTNVTGRLNGGVDGLLGLTTSANQGGTSATSGTQTNVNAGNSKTVTGTGNGVFTLRFTFTTSASSPQNIINGDEQAARFGLQGTMGSTSADDYSGPSGALRPNGLSSDPLLGDGHFVNAVLTVVTVPEPSTFALLGLGLIGLGAMRFRRK